VFFASLFASIVPIGGRLLNLMPSNGTTALFTILLVFSFIAATLGLTGFIIVSSMMADVVEDAAVSTGQRSEGLLFAVNGLISKCVTGVGTFVAGLVLAWVSFPRHATPGQVDELILRHLGMIFVPTVTLFSGTAITVLMFYQIDRSTHQRNIERLQSAAALDADAAEIGSGR
jgi:glycoside/pentoside/hexuronide:cation symporter, GPH family